MVNMFFYKYFFKVGITSLLAVYTLKWVLVDTELEKYDESYLRSVWVNHTLNDANLGMFDQLNRDKPALFLPYIKYGFVAQCIQVIGIDHVGWFDNYRIDGVVTFKDVRSNSIYENISVPFVSIYEQTWFGLLGISEEYDINNNVQAFEPVESYFPFDEISEGDYLPGEKYIDGFKSPSFLNAQNGECPDASAYSEIQSNKSYKPMAVLKPSDETSAMVWVGSLNPNSYRSEKEREDFRKAEEIRRRKERERAAKIAMGGVFSSFGRMLQKSFPKRDADKK